MVWNAYLYDTVTGALGQKIDIPAFSWSVSVSDSSFSTTRDKGTGVDDVSGLQVPWSQINASTPEARAAMLMPYKRGIVLFWKQEGDDSLGVPVLAGALGVRTSTRNDVEMPFVSMMGLLEDRFFVHEDPKFASGPNHTSTGFWEFKNLSWRAVACEILQQAIKRKPGGALPIDLPYLGEKGTHQLPDDGQTYEPPKPPILTDKQPDNMSKEQREAYDKRKDAAEKQWEAAKARLDGRSIYRDFDVSSHSVAELLTSISNQDKGPDLQFRPYLADDQHIRFRFEAGSDADVFLLQKTRLSLSSGPWGGTLENIRVDRAAPYMRVFATGAGSDDATLCAFQQDLSLVSRADPWPLRESVLSNNNVEDFRTLDGQAKSLLNATNRPLMQVRGEIWADDVDASGLPLHPLGSFWPGELFDVAIDGFPDLPDGVYPMRLMQMTGDESAKVELLFDVVADPVM
ncbi:hypothetical protein [Bifidobacterium magnum]|uniref:Putative major tail protein n=1 Tax=Bifidobacterium magnum TaxID=1692 RepID=A0A087B699_9BIFI|nr:hypothetical protein [Bifidobacterium magnum]KFI66549.1 putative major tail protein [Bifidobacterium magnum]